MREVADGTQHTHEHATDESPGKLSDARREAARREGWRKLARLSAMHEEKGDRYARRNRPQLDAGGRRCRHREEKE